MGKTFKIGILGAGWIAGKMAETVAAMDGYEIFAVASRSLEKAQAFASKWNICKAFGSYEELVSEKEIDMIYIATPHSHHYQHTKLAIEHGKPCLVEKAFTANAREAKDLLEFAKKRNVFVTEAIWTRYMPLSHKIKELLENGAIGEPRLLSASLCYPLEDKERITNPALCGGALLDVGVYVLNFARMYFGNNVVKTVTNCQLGETEMDMQESISLSYADGKMANLQAGARCLNDRQGIISGTEGYIRVDNVNCPERVEVYRNYSLVETYLKPENMISGYEYQVMESRRCIESGLLESPMMPHAETISVMQQMDSLRKEWGVVYPMDKQY
ncbi:MAG: Gfo/Idh/MocA family oxidoreductase [Bacteroidales bacterium]|nr:Gfo/Idh/MocA family oxidoreductase [Bacteroidales bacterium]